MFIFTYNIRSFSLFFCKNNYEIDDKRIFEKKCTIKISQITFKSMSQHYKFFGIRKTQQHYMYAPYMNAHTLYYNFN